MQHRDASEAFFEHRETVRNSPEPCALKENRDFQDNTKKIHIAFPPMATCMCYTDSVPHAVLFGQDALEQTFIIPVRALATPEKSPIRVLEKMAGKPLARETAKV